MNALNNSSSDPAAERTTSAVHRRKRATAGLLQRVAASVVREPFFQFIALGLLIWLGIGYAHGHTERYVIHVGPQVSRQLSAAYLLEYKEPPTAAQLQQLLHQYVTEEIYLREGLALGLAKGDEIVRRRVVQKFKFVQTDLAVPPAPGPGVLDAWFARNRGRYARPPAVTFTQIYFSPDAAGESGARTRASQALHQLGAGAERAPALGDAFPGPVDVVALTPDAAERLFGKSELSAALFTSPVRHWVGPFKSGYGWHLIRVSHRAPPESPPLDEVRSRVLADYLEQQRQILDQQNLEQIRAKYSVVRDAASS